MLSAIALILGAAFVSTRQEASENPLESIAKRGLLADGRQASLRVFPAWERQLDRTAKKRPASLQTW